MAEYFWTAIEWGSYLKKTTKLTLAHHGAYLLLMAEYYQTGQPLPAIASDLFRVCRAFDEAEREAVLFVLDKYFVRDGDFYRHERIDEELKKAAEVSEKRSVAGKLGVEAKRTKRQANAKANASAEVKQNTTQLQSQLQTPIGDVSQIVAVAKAYPKLSHLKDETEIPYATSTAIIQGVEKDGFELVLQGTTAYAKSLDDPRFAVKPYEFFTEFQYRKYVTNAAPRKWKVVGNG